MTKSLCKNPESPVSVSPVKTGFMERCRVEMGRGFVCDSCNYQFPAHADWCQYHPDNLGKK